MMCLTNDGVERKARTRNTDDDRVGSTKSECVRCSVFHKKQISQDTEKGEERRCRPESRRPRAQKSPTHSKQPFQRQRQGQRSH
jgi:hypothetical protein